MRRRYDPLFATLRFAAPNWRTHLVKVCEQGIRRAICEVVSGAPPQNGAYTTIIAGAVIGLLGGSRVQVFWADGRVQAKPYS